MFLGGLWTFNSGFDIHSYTVVTTAATEAFAPIHHRLPLILEQREIDCWLDDDWNTACDLLHPTKCAIIATHISNDVGNVRNNHPGLLTPLK